MTVPWTPSRLGNLTGKRVIVTGATNGVGLGTAQALAKTGAHVILAVRNTDLGKQPLMSLAHKAHKVVADRLANDIDEGAAPTLYCISEPVPPVAAIVWL